MYCRRYSSDMSKLIVQWITFILNIKYNMSINVIVHMNGIQNFKIMYEYYGRFLMKWIFTIVGILFLWNFYNIPKPVDRG